MLPNPQPYFAHLPDPRRETKNKLHKLGDIVMIVLCAVLSGIEDWVGMETFAEEREEWFRGFLELPNGIPSHDTLSDVMGRLNPTAFRQTFLEWVEAGLPSLASQHVAIDGKTLRGSRGREGPVHLLSAFASQARWVLAQCAVEGKSNEIKAIPKLLEMLDLEGATVTVDAIGCQKAIAEQVIEQRADYVLALKDNHPQLHEDVRLWLDTQAQAGQLSPMETIEKDHGRLEIRHYFLSNQIEWLPERSDWRGLCAVGMVEAIRDTGFQISVERRYFLCSFDDLDHFAGVVRAHWSIENSQHWVLDVQFGEDRNRTRTDHAPENLALVRRTALNLVRQNGNPKESLKRRRLRASLNDDYRWQLLAGQQT
jgi:predicted transposase YbfD/YdcC